MIIGLEVWRLTLMELEVGGLIEVLIWMCWFWPNDFDTDDVLVIDAGEEPVEASLNGAAIVVTGSRWVSWLVEIRWPTRPSDGWLAIWFTVGGARVNPFPVLPSELAGRPLFMPLAAPRWASLGPTRVRSTFCKPGCSLSLTDSTGLDGVSTLAPTLLDSLDAGCRACCCVLGVGATRSSLFSNPFDSGKNCCRVGGARGAWASTGGLAG